jgi:hypothetical protein
VSTRSTLHGAQTGATLWPMLAAARSASFGLRTVALALAASAVGCAGVETRVHLAAPNDFAWVVEDEDGDRVCALPCTVELEESERVTVARADGSTTFVVQQEALGPGEFSGTVRTRAERRPQNLAARIVSMAIAGAGQALVESDDDDHVLAGVVLSGIGAVALAATDRTRAHHQELWLERSATP